MNLEPAAIHAILMAVVKRVSRKALADPVTIQLIIYTISTWKILSIEETNTGSTSSFTI